MPDKNRFIELISDTATRPTEGMRLAMAAAEVGDEQRGEDPSVNWLCVRVANLLGHEAGVYLPSGIMSNLIAMLVHCRPGDEILAAGNAHIIGSEGAGAAAIAGALISTIDTPDGRFSSADVANRLRPPRARAPRTSLVLVEQTSNKGGGTIWPAAQIADIAETTHSGGAALHMDGARLLNADGSLQAASYRRDPRPLRAIRQAISGSAADIALDTRGDVTDVEAISGALMLMETSRFRELGGFDEGFRLHVEDLDLCRRAREAGLRVAVANRVEVTHAKGASSKARPVWVEWQKHRGMWRYFRKHDALSTPLLLRPLLWLGMWAHFALAAPLAWWRAR